MEIADIADRKTHHWKMHVLLEEVNFHCHVSLLEGKTTWAALRNDDSKYFPFEMVPFLPVISIV